VGKYPGESESGWGALESLGLHKVTADLYFTLPFDLGIIDATAKFFCQDDPTQGDEERFGKVFLGEPFEVDRAAGETIGVQADYLQLIESARSQVLF
jgi:hypothetical protein